MLSVPVGIRPLGRPRGRRMPDYEELAAPAAPGLLGSGPRDRCSVNPVRKAVPVDSLAVTVRKLMSGYDTRSLEIRKAEAVASVVLDAGLTIGEAVRVLMGPASVAAISPQGEAQRLNSYHNEMDRLRRSMSMRSDGRPWNTAAPIEPAQPAPPPQRVAKAAPKRTLVDVKKDLIRKASAFFPDYQQETFAELVDSSSDRQSLLKNVADYVGRHRMEAFAKFLEGADA